MSGIRTRPSPSPCRHEYVIKSTIQSPPSNTRFVRIFHITSPTCALAIVESGIFYPASTHRLNNDNGLNCFDARPGYRMGQCFEGVGARLVLEWNGPVVATHPNTSPPLTPDLLHIQHPWRCFIRGGTNKQLLRVVGIQFSEDALGAVLEAPDWHSFLPTCMRDRLNRRTKLNFFRSLRNRYRNNRLYLQVNGQ